MALYSETSSTKVVLKPLQNFVSHNDYRELGWSLMWLSQSSESPKKNVSRSLFHNIHCIILTNMLIRFNLTMHAKIHSLHVVDSCVLMMIHSCIHLKHLLVYFHQEHGR